MRILYTIFSALIAIVLLSCEGIIGEDGVVIDNTTGERMAGVSTTLKFRSTTEIDITDTVGYFNVTKMIGCGLGDCDDKYEITFVKEGYVSTIINEDYYSSEEAKFINQEDKDTLIIKLVPKM